MDIYKSTKGDSWFTKTYWGTSDNYCYWHGVLCDTKLNVQSLQLDVNNLDGSIPSSFSDLKYLRYVNLSSNNIALPSRIDNPILNTFDASNNKPISSVPFFASARLSELRLSRCGLKSVPDKATNSSKFLKVISFDNNQLSGTIPFLSSNWGVKINLSNNRFSGSIPSDKFGNPNWLDLSWNNLTGSLPDSVSYASSLSYLDISHNMISGSADIPLYAMKYLDLSYNRFSDIVSRYGEFEYLDYCNLEGNPNFRCNLPSWVSYICYVQCTGN